MEEQKIVKKGWNDEQKKEYHQNKINRRYQRRLATFISRQTDKILKTKEDILSVSNPNYSTKVRGFRIDMNYFCKHTTNFNEQQWQDLITYINNLTKNKQIEKTRSNKLAVAAKEAIVKINEIIKDDDFLKNHNIFIAELVCEGSNYFIAKIYLICGSYFIDGDVNRIISIIRKELKSNKVNIRVFCPSCSSKELRFISHYCGCNDCGTLSDFEKNKVVKKYDVTKGNWWAEVILDVGMRWV